MSAVFLPIFFFGEFLFMKKYKKNMKPPKHMFLLATFVRPFSPYISLRLQSGFRSVKNDFRNRQFTLSWWNLILFFEHRKNNRFFNFERSKPHRYAIGFIICIEFTGIFFLLVSGIMDPPNKKRQKPKPFLHTVCVCDVFDKWPLLLNGGWSVGW